MIWSVVAIWTRSMLEFVKIILAKKIWSVVAIWSILVQIFLAIKWHQYLLFYLQTCHFYLPATPHKHNSVWSQLQSTSPCCRCRRPTDGGGPRSEGGSNTGRRRGDQGIAADTTAALAPWASPPTRCARAGAALAASDREGFGACGEEDRGECPARDGNDAGTGGYRRAAAPRPHRHQLCRLDAAHLESTAMAVTTATSWEHEDNDGGGDCEDVTDGGRLSPLSGGSCPSRPAGAVVVMPHV